MGYCLDFPVNSALYDRRDRRDLCEELGDLLLQVVYHARISEEEGSFTFADVVEGITGKMIRWHPHVFGTPAERKAVMTDDTWKKIKAGEKAGKLARRQQTADEMHDSPSVLS